MLRRLVVLAGVLTTVALVPTIQTVAAPSFHAKRVCGISTSPTRAECFALVQTDAAGRVVGAALPSGYGPSQFHSAYNLPITSPSNQTIAIVDAFSNPNVISNLNTYDSTFGLPVFPKCGRAVTTSCIAVLNQL